MGCAPALRAYFDPCGSAMAARSTSGIMLRNASSMHWSSKFGSLAPSGGDSPSGGANPWDSIQSKPAFAASSSSVGGAGGSIASRMCLPRNAYASSVRATVPGPT